MRILFTGHRNRRVDPELFTALAREFKGALWVHGCAIGFDRQVDGWAYGYNLVPQPERNPVTDEEYAQYGPKRAPIMRNKRMVDMGADLVIACWDGREGGGTLATMKLAAQAGIPIRTWPAI